MLERNISQSHPLALSVPLFDSVEFSLSGPLATPTLYDAIESTPDGFIMQHECYLVDPQTEDEERVRFVIPATWRHEWRLPSPNLAPKPLLMQIPAHFLCFFFHLVLKGPVELNDSR